MKKLVYLLVLSLCLNGVAGVASAWSQPAVAETKSEAKAEKQSAGKEKKDKSSGKASKQSSDEKSDADKAEKKTKVKKEKEYTLDLAENSQVQLSVVIEYAKLNIKLKDVKAIELEDEKDKKRISWEPDKENESDYIITVLKDFKELRLRIVTKKTSRLLVLLNGAKAGAAKPAEEAAETVEKPVEVPAQETIQKPAEAPAEEAVQIEVEAIPENEDQPSGEVPEPSETDTEKTDAEKQTGFGNVEGTPEAPASPATEEAGLATEEGTPEPTDDTQDGTEEQDETENIPQAATETPEAAIEGQGEMPAEQPEAVEGQNEAPEGQPGTQPESQQAQIETPAAQEAVAEPQTEAPAAQEAVAEPQGEAPAAQEAAAEPQGEAPASQEAAAEPQVEAPASQEAVTEPQGEAPEGQDTTPEAPVETAPAAEEQPAESSEVGSGEAEVPQTAPEEVEPQPEKGALIPTEAEAWFKRGTELMWGTLEEVVGALVGGETVYIQSGNVLPVKAAPLALLSTVKLLPDGDVFKGSFSVRISAEDPAAVSEPALLQPEQLLTLGERGDLYIWVVQDETATPEEGEQGGEADKPVLTVSATGLVESGWTRTQPQFTLSGIPEGKNWSYAAIIYDERIVPIAANVYAPEQEGVYTLRFAMLDELGDIMAASDQYTLQMDWTAPEVSIEADEETSYTLDISASDNVSGIDTVSIDGGKTWQSMKDGDFTVTEDAETTFAEGMIRVRDIAGNEFISEEEYTVSEVEGEYDGEEDGEEGGGGGGGSGNGSGTPALPHASGDGEEGSDYDALTLDLPDEPMEQLTVGGEAMDLTLLLASAQEPNAPVGFNQPFTAALKHWEDASDSDAPNTLVLNAEVDANLGDVFSYEWRFNGEVYRMLANSGIRYVALKVCDAVAAFPTEGFTGGTRYTELKMQGVSTRRFDYTLTMKLNLDPSHVSAMNESDYSEVCDLSIHTQVEDKNYELSNSPQSMMYFYNVFVGPEDMMDQPFGEYDATA